MRVRTVAAHVVAPTMLGALLYVGFRDQGLLGWEWARDMGVAGVLGDVREALLPLRPALSDLVVFSLPDALWVYSLTFAVAYLWMGKGGIERILWLLVPVGMGLGAEVGQLAGVVPGTFDPADLLACSVAVVLAVWFERRSRRRREAAARAAPVGARSAAGGSQAGARTR